MEILLLMENISNLIVIYYLCLEAFNKISLTKIMPLLIMILLTHFVVKTQKKNSKKDESILKIFEIKYEINNIQFLI